MSNVIFFARIVATKKGESTRVLLNSAHFTESDARDAIDTWRSANTIDEFSVVCAAVNVQITLPVWEKIGKLCTSFKNCFSAEQPRIQSECRIGTP
jgi:hypothetical protein